MIEYAPGVVMLGVAAATFSWLAVDCVELFIPLSRRSRILGIVAMLALIAALCAPYVEKFKYAPRAPRPPIPCTEGADFDVRDSLCYPVGSVPKEFQRY
jgi:hypothetical protein